MKNKIIMILLGLVVANYTQDIKNCAKYDTMEKRNVCRQNVTQKYKYVKEDEIELHLFTLPKVQKNVVNFREVFQDE